MIKPLSVWKYYKNNQRKVVAVFLVTFLCVFLQSVLLAFATAMINFQKATTLGLVSSLGIIATEQLSPENRQWLRQSLEQGQGVSQVIPSAIRITSLYGLNNAYILFLHSKDTEAVMNCLNLSLIDGQLPNPGSTDVALHWKIAANKGLKIGDHFSRKTSKTELLIGDCRLVGLLDGTAAIGIADFDCPEQKLTESELVNVIIPKKGQFLQVKNYIAQLIQENDDLWFYNSDAEESFYRNETDSIVMILNIIYLVITGIVIICVSFLFYIYFYQRRSEFALLEALGHSRQTIIGKAFLEIAGINLLGFIAGILIAAVCEGALNHFILFDRGLSLALWDSSYAFKLLSTPLVITFTSLLPVWRLLKKVDPLSIIEGDIE